MAIIILIHPSQKNASFYYPNFISIKNNFSSIFHLICRIPEYCEVLFLLVLSHLVNQDREGHHVSICWHWYEGQWPARSSVYLLFGYTRRKVSIGIEFNCKTREWQRYCRHLPVHDRLIMQCTGESQRAVISSCQDIPVILSRVNRFQRQGWYLPHDTRVRKDSIVTRWLQQIPRCYLSNVFLE